MVRNALLVAAIGVNLVAANAFDVANKLPNILFALLASGMLNSVLVPQIVRAYRTDRSQEIIDKLLTTATLLIAGLTAALTLASPLLVRLYIDDWTPAQTALAVTFAYWCVPQLFFYGLYTLLGQVLNAREQFGPYMWSPVVNNLISIAGFIVFIQIYGGYDPAVTDDMSSWTGAKIALLAGTATAGIVAQALVLLIPLYRSGFRWNLRFGVRGIGLRTAGHVALWTLAAGVLDQIGVLLITRIGSAAARVSGGALDVAGNSAYTNALTLYLLPHSLITVSIATALFTRISKSAAADDLPAVRRDLSLGLRSIGLFTVFAAAVLMVLALPLVLVTIPSAGPVQAVTVAHVLVAMAPGIVGLGGMVMLRWVYYAFEDGRTVFLVQVPATALLVGGAYLAQAKLPVHWWVAGIGAAMTVSGVLVVVGRLLIIKRHVGPFNLVPVALLHGKATLAALVAAAAGMGVVHLFGDIRSAGWFTAFAATAIGGVMMASVYLIVLRVLRTTELAAALVPVLRRLTTLIGTKRVEQLTRLLVGQTDSDVNPE